MDERITEPSLERVKRCDWRTTDPIYLDYHDHEWGRPQFDSQTLFEMLCLEGMQAGLSWMTILKRRDNYRKAFDGFNPVVIADYTEEDMDRLMKNVGIIRNRRKIEAIVANARAYLAIEKEQSFSNYLWTFIGGQPITHHYEHHNDIPPSSKESEQMSQALKKCGFKFVGKTICYAFMQAVGMVNDHELSCFCYRQIAEKNQKPVQ